MIEPKWRSWLSLSFFLSPFIFRVWLQEQTWGSLGERPRAPVKDRGRGQTPGGGPTVLLCHKGPLLFRPPFERVMLRWRGQMMQIPARPLASTHAASPDITGCLSSPLLQGCFTTIEPQNGFTGSIEVMSSPHARGRGHGCQKPRESGGNPARREAERYFCKVEARKSAYVRETGCGVRSW